jgi:hypothetical protein
VVVKAAMDMLVLVTPAGQVAEEVDPAHPEAPCRLVDLELLVKAIPEVMVQILEAVMATVLEVAAVAPAQLAVLPVVVLEALEEQDYLFLLQEPVFFMLVVEVAEHIAAQVDQVDLGVEELAQVVVQLQLQEQSIQVVGQVLQDILLLSVVQQQQADLVLS